MVPLAQCSRVGKAEISSHGGIIRCFHWLVWLLVEEALYLCCIAGLGSYGCESAGQLEFDLSTYLPAGWQDECDAESVG